MIKALEAPLNEIACYEDLKDTIRKISERGGAAEISGCLDSQKCHLAAGLSGGTGSSLIIAEDELKARGLYEDMQAFNPDVLFFPGRDLIFYKADVAGNLLTRQRMQVIKAVAEQKNVMVVTPVRGCLDRLLPLRVLKNKRITLKRDDETDLGALARKLSEAGYERVVRVETAGQFAVRGDIVDVFPMTEENPWRIEFFGDTVDQIRVFDPESQRSLNSVDGEISIYPASEDGDRLTDTFPDYFPKGSVFFLDEGFRVFESSKAICNEYQEAVSRRIEEGSADPGEEDLMITPEILAAEFERRGCVDMSLMGNHSLPFEITDRFHIEAKSVNSYSGQLPMLVRDLQKCKKNGYRVVILSESRTRGKRLADHLRDEGLNALWTDDAGRSLSPGEILIVHGSSGKGFEYPLQKYMLLTDSDIFGRSAKKKKKRSRNIKPGDRIRSFSELSDGDYVVHEDHGLGIYRGIEKVEVDHVKKDYIRIEYAGGSSLYVPATQLDLLQKYSGASEGHHPRINKLGGREWAATKSRVKASVKSIASDLVKLYAARSVAGGYRYSPDTPWQAEFEELFPFEETEDQLRAIEDVKKDMESPKVMDRLICGDVGYGKTEIALRAAFKAVQENKQVVMLCPTTILAQQHYNTFVQRMSGYPVNIDMLSRFRKPAEQKKTIEKVKTGQVDILIGTHRVLSKDVKFRDLGLLIIDEEQRFGVRHKERIKELKKSVDVITLTATPIPRTLHMSLIGIRDMSVLEEPPLDRMPVQTYVMEYDNETVREAISRELARGGQVFLVYNRIQGIADMALRIRTLVPEADVAYAHGQMRENDLEKIMYDFVSGNIDVLVSTTIIETGLDISNANTLIVCDADRMGLAQLYQLRGRVGRSGRNAYAFFMYRRDKVLRENAEKRLNAIREFTGFGSGVRIAMRDLEIRGAGNLLGAEQSGHMEAVGYDLYCKMLGEAVKEAKGSAAEDDFETSVDLDIDAYIPDTYIPDETEKLDIYQRIAAIENENEASDITDELIDRFGDPPAPVNDLVRTALLKRHAHEAKITEIRQTGNIVRISIYENAVIDAAGISGILEEKRFENRLFFRPGKGKPYFEYSTTGISGRRAGNLLSSLEDVVKELGEMVLIAVADTAQKSYNQ